MKIVDFFKFGKKPEAQEKQNIEASRNYGTYIPLGTRALPFDGERNLNDMGPAINYVPQYGILATRSWQAYMDSPLAKTIIDKWANWIVGYGLAPKATPSKIVLKTEGIDLTKTDTEQFNDVVESRWSVWAGSKRSSFNNNETFNELSKSIFLNSKINGDVLIILKYVKGIVKIQYIDGQRVCNPMSVTAENGNFISNGVEVSPTGEIVRYHVMKNGMPGEWETVDAYNKQTGLRTAFLVQGSRWRIDYYRGLPVIAQAMETISKMDRYREATVSSAEEVAKIAYQIIHQNFSDGSSPLSQQLSRAIDNSQSGALPVDAAGEAFADRIAVTTQKSAFNNPKGAKIETIDKSTTVAGFENFYKTNADIICSAVGIPPNVALSVYNDSFSASRAATKDWDHTMDVERDAFAVQFLNYVYKFWLYIEIATGKIQAPGFLDAFVRDNYMVTESYEKVRFTGPHFPHIDPVKEVRAEREKLGDQGKSIPLTTAEAATEALGGGDSDSNIEQFSDELKMIEDNGIIKPVSIPDQPKDV